MAVFQPLLDAPIVRRSNSLRSFLTGAWLGWQIESNWAKPGLFAIYAIARPIASSLILVIMYNVITNGATGEPLFAYIFLGNALYILVNNVVSGISWAVIDDREHYRVAKQLHTAPISYYAYLVGRGAARMMIGAISVIITVVFGLIAFQLPIHFGQVDWGLFAVGMVFGLAAMAGLGTIIAAMTMQLPQNFWFIGEGIGGALYVFTGAIFPIDVLPTALQWIGFLFPITYWLEAMRRALLGDTAARFPTLAGFSDAQLIGILAVMAAVLVVGSYLFYRWSLYLAKENGRLDMETSY